MEDCKICFLEHPSTNMAGIRCGHRFCRQCWVEYLTLKITGDGPCDTITCASSGCEGLVDDITVMVLTEPEVRLMYQQLVKNSFIENSRFHRWCPSPGCSHAVKVNISNQVFNAEPIKCKCGHVFCFECGEQWHAPVICSILRLWISKSVDDSESTKWILVNTKDCPKCNSAIQKNGGCNHMVSAREKFQIIPTLHSFFIRAARTKAANIASAGFAFENGLTRTGTTATATMPRRHACKKISKRISPGKISKYERLWLTKVSF